eukprot:g28338.t1
MEAAQLTEDEMAEIKKEVSLLPLFERNVKGERGFFLPVSGAHLPPYRAGQVSGSEASGHTGALSCSAQAGSCTWDTAVWVHLGTEAGVTGAQVHLGTEAGVTGAQVHLGTEAGVTGAQVHLGTEAGVTGAQVHLGTEVCVTGAQVHPDTYTWALKLVELQQRGLAHLGT